MSWFSPDALSQLLEYPILIGTVAIVYLMYKIIIKLIGVIDTYVRSDEVNK